MLNTLETLDRYNFHRADSSNSIDTLYSKIFADSTKSGGQVKNFTLLQLCKTQTDQEGSRKQGGGKERGGGGGGNLRSRGCYTHPSSPSTEKYGFMRYQLLITEPWSWCPEIKVLEDRVLGKFC